LDTSEGDKRRKGGAMCQEKGGRRGGENKVRILGVINDKGDERVWCSTQGGENERGKGRGTKENF